ncbi:hypothetical protein [Nakamurella aerolata]|uniref:Uncharacterized protein n=1 Tax=Nakamurella aerolata TaxID=1656892 RepID=A0A849A8I5_9ACTN|nr:hypothetical protein [Nakamurella aerolata]NNG35391.1 hypothetical protein [Nakamurella aerolata]
MSDQPSGQSEPVTGDQAAPRHPGNPPAEAGAAAHRASAPAGGEPGAGAATGEPGTAGAARLPAQPSTPPPGGPADPRERRVSPIAHPPVTLPPNPMPPRRFGGGEIIIIVSALAAFASTFLSWVTPDFGAWRNAWTTGLWPAGVLALLAAIIHLVRMLPPPDRAIGALLPLLLSTAAIWIPIAALPDNGNAWGVWVCLAGGVVLTGALIVAAMSDPALRRPDDPDDLFN